MALDDAELSKLYVYRLGKSDAVKAVIDRYVEMAKDGLAIHRWVDGELQIIATDKEGTKTYKFKILTPSGTETTFTPPKIAMFGFDPAGAMIVRSLFNMMGSTENLAGLQGNLMPLLMMGGDMEDLGDILPMMMMGGMGAGGLGGANMGSMMQTMMMMKMMGKTLGTTKSVTKTAGAPSGHSYFNR